MQARIPLILLLPPELQLSIWKYLTPEEILSSRLVHPDLAASLLANNALWRAKSKQHFPQYKTVFASNEDGVPRNGWCGEFVGYSKMQYRRFHKLTLDNNGNEVRHLVNDKTKYLLYRKAFSLIIEKRCTELQVLLASSNFVIEDFNIADRHVSFATRAAILKEAAQKDNNPKEVAAYQNVLDIIYMTYKEKMNPDHQIETIWHEYNITAKAANLILHAISCHQETSKVATLLDEFRSIYEQYHRSFNLILYKAIFDKIDQFIPHAIRYGTQDTIELIINTEDSQNKLCKALHVAVNQTKYDAIDFIVKKLQRFAVLQMTSDEKIEKLFVRSYQSGNIEIVKRLMPLMPIILPRHLCSSLGNTNTECFDYVIQKNPLAMPLALFSIIDHENVNLLSHCINDLGVSVNVSNREDTLLTYAIKRHSNLVPTLLDAGADVNARDGNSLTPISIALRECFAVEDIIESKPNFLDEQGPDFISAVLSAKMSNAYRLQVLAKLFLLRPNLINQPTKTGLTPLMHACHVQDFWLAEFLIEQGAHVNASIIVDGEKRNAVYYAVNECDMFSMWLHNDYKSIVELLIEKGADPYQCFGGNNILHLLLDNASRNPQDTIDRIVTSHPKLLEMPDNNGNTALGRKLLALQPNKDPWLADRLIKLGANVNVLVNMPDGTQRSALFLYLCILPKSQIVYEFICKGVDSQRVLQECKTLPREFRERIENAVKQAMQKIKAIHAVDKVISSVNRDDWKYLSFFNSKIKMDKTATQNKLSNFRELVVAHYTTNPSPLTVFSKEERKVIKAFPKLHRAYNFLKR